MAPFIEIIIPMSAVPRVIPTDCLTWQGRCSSNEQQSCPSSDSGMQLDEVLGFNEVSGLPIFKKGAWSPVPPNPSVVFWEWAGSAGHWGLKAS